MTAPAGAVNAWKCERCGGLLVAIHLVEGTTPMFLGCRAVGCDGRGVSAGYPPAPIPSRILDAVSWEWRLPSTTERKRWKSENPAMLDHVTRGGLVLAPLSPAGRELLAKIQHQQETNP